MDLSTGSLFRSPRTFISRTCTRLPIWRLILLSLSILAVFQISSSSYFFGPPKISGELPLLSADGGYTYSGRVTQKVATGRVVVTGGGGNVGKHIVHSLLATSTPVTVIDTIFFEDELEYLPPSSRSLLDVHIGDVRNATALSAVFTPDVVGVVHLAAVSRVLWCLENEADCWDVNERGTQMVVDGLAELNKRDGGKRWFILASSREVYGDAKDNKPIKEDAEKAPANIYGASKLAAEVVIEKHLRSAKQYRSSGSIHFIALRLSNVYGGVYDHLERLVPSIVTQALSHQVIQISGGQQHFDLLHIEDCIDAFLLAIHHATTNFRASAFEQFNVASGDSVPVDKLVNTLVSLIRSKSPVRYIPGDARFPNVYRGNTEKAQRVLGYTPAVTIEEGLLRYVKAYLRRTRDFLDGRIKETCGEASPSLVANAQIEKLDGCYVHIEVDVLGQFAPLKPPEGDEPWSITNEVAPHFLHTAISHQPGSHIPRIRLHTSDSDHTFFGIFEDAFQPGPVTLSKLTAADVDSGAAVIVEWELEVNAEQSAVRLVVPGTDYFLVSPTTVGGRFSLVSKAARNVWPFRITPTCCPSPVPWPFARDDPIEHSVQFVRTSLERPFLSSPAKTLCSRLRRASLKASSSLATISDVTLQEPRRRLSSLPTDWANANLPACSNICEHPTICVDTSDCQCVLSSCAPRQRFPFASSAHSPFLSFPPPPSTELSLVQMVSQSSWRNVLRPQASRFVGAQVPFPRVHVAPLSPADQNMLSEDGLPIDFRGKLRDHHCFTADTQMEKGVSMMGVRRDEAEMTFIPSYQQWDADHRLLERTWEFNRDTFDGFDASKVIIPFTHDFGQCLAFEWDVWHMRERQGLRVHPLVRSTTAWSVMGDLNSACYRPHQDIIIPPRTCLSPSLFKSFPTVADVRPARDRRVLVAFNGVLWGTGALNRNRLVCHRSHWDSDDDASRRLHASGPNLKSLVGTNGDYEYMGLLNDTVFCPQPAGTTGWATRLVDSMYAGCIPVLIGQASHFPFYDMLDWGKISIRVEPSDLAQLEDILFSRYSLVDIERLQANIMLVRDALVYPLDDVDDTVVREGMIERRGPLFFALHSTRMRMLTEWPVDDVFDRP